MDTTQPEELLADDLSVAAVAREYVGKELPIDVRTDIYGSDDPLQRTLKEQLLHIIGVSYYLNPDTGNDNNDGSAERPWKTLAYAFEQVYAMQEANADHAYINLVLGDGVYTGEGQTYVTLGKRNGTTVSNVRITSQSHEHRAVLDGGWGPEKLTHYYDEADGYKLKSDIQGSFYDNIAHAYWKQRPDWAPLWYKGAPDGHNGHALYNNLLQLINCKNVTIDGLRIQNSIGRGIEITNEKYHEASPTFCENITVKNCRIDWCHFGAIKVGWDQDTCTIENNIITRGAFDWWINLPPIRRHDETGLPVDSDGKPVSDPASYVRYRREVPKEHLPPGHEMDQGPVAMNKVDMDGDDIKETVVKGNWGATILWANNATIRNNVCAFSYGEVASRPRSSGPEENDGAVVEGNIFLGNSNNCYLEGLKNTTVRNNLLVCIPDDTEAVDTTIEDKKLKVDEHASSKYVYRRGKCFAIANENKNQWCFGKLKNPPENEPEKKDYAYCGSIEDEGKILIVDHLNDDLRVYNNLLLYGPAVFRALNGGRKRPISKLYFGHNTIVAAPDASESILTTSMSEDAWISGILENNIWDNRLNEIVDWEVNEGKGIANTLRIRNNIFPTQAPEYLKLEDDDVENVYDAAGNVLNVTNAPQLRYGEAALPIQPPATNLTNAQMDSHLDAVLTTLKDNVHWFKLNGGAVAIDNGSEAGEEHDTPVPSAARDEDFFGNDRVGKPDIGAIEYSA